ncbi:MAG: DALR anticodon-binding domain-containing protein, partial [Gammaproteobacteria bacterium]
LDTLLSSALAGFGSVLADARTQLESFIYDRLSGYLKDLGYSTLEVDSVVSLRPPLIYLVRRQLDAVRAFNRLPEAESLAAANKRVANILRQAAARGESFSDADAGGLKEAAERSLFEALKKTSERAAKLFDQGDFTGYLKSFAVLKSPVDAFFDSVMVMVDDPALRKNRLALLADLRKEMNRVADISRLAA